MVIVDHKLAGCGIVYSKEVCTNGSKHFILLWSRFFCVNKKVIYDEMKFEQSDKSLNKPKTSRRVNAGLQYSWGSCQAGQVCDNQKWRLAKA